jgi:hypothetical protein
MVLIGLAVVLGGQIPTTIQGIPDPMIRAAFQCVILIVVIALAAKVVPKEPKIPKAPKSIKSDEITPVDRGVVIREKDEP